MKFYSETLNEIFDTQEELEAEEFKAKCKDDGIDKLAAAKKAYSEASKICDKMISDAKMKFLDEYDRIRKEYISTLDEAQTIIEDAYENLVLVEDEYAQRVKEEDEDIPFTDYDCTFDDFAKWWKTFIEKLDTDNQMKE